MPSMLLHYWLGVRKSIRPVKKLSDGVLAWLSFWCRLTQVVLEKRPLNVCVCVSVINF